VRDAPLERRDAALRDEPPLALRDEPLLALRDEPPLPLRALDDLLDARREPDDPLDPPREPEDPLEALPDRADAADERLLVVAPELLRALEPALDPPLRFAVARERLEPLDVFRAEDALGSEPLPLVDPPAPFVEDLRLDVRRGASLWLSAAISPPLDRHRGSHREPSLRWGQRTVGAYPVDAGSTRAATLAGQIPDGC
jgi:hypothetical protein